MRDNIAPQSQQSINRGVHRHEIKIANLCNLTPIAHLSSATIVGHHDVAKHLVRKFRVLSKEWLDPHVTVVLLPDAGAAVGLVYLHGPQMVAACNPPQILPA